MEHEMAWVFFIINNWQRIVLKLERGMLTMTQHNQDDPLPLENVKINLSSRLYRLSKIQTVEISK